MADTAVSDVTWTAADALALPQEQVACVAPCAPWATWPVEGMPDER